MLPAAHQPEPQDGQHHAKPTSCKGCTWRRVIDGTLQCTHQRTADPITDTRCNHYEERTTA